MPHAVLRSNIACANNLVKKYNYLEMLFDFARIWICNESRNAALEEVMCFRPSAVDGVRNDIKYGECPTCGGPVASNPGVSSGTCPYCGNAIPANNSTDNGSRDPSKNVRII